MAKEENQFYKKIDMLNSVCKLEIIFSEIRRCAILHFSPDAKKVGTNSHWRQKIIVNEIIFRRGNRYAVIGNTDDSVLSTAEFRMYVYRPLEQGSGDPAETMVPIARDTAASIHRPRANAK